MTILKIGIFFFISMVPLPSYTMMRSITTALSHIYADHRYTFFCHQSFSAQGLVHIKACEQCPTQTTPIQWMALVPTKKMAQHLLCYQEKICIDNKGQRFKGLRCCQHNNEIYQQMQKDLHNFVPELPFLKQQRQRLVFGNISVETDAYPECFVIDKKRKILIPSREVRGMIARTYLYMRDKYHITLTPEETRLYLDWHQEYPVSVWERKRNQRIQDIQGNSNHYVS